MKKVIRLSENDLINIVKRIVNEQVSDEYLDRNYNTSQNYLTQKPTGEGNKNKFKVITPKKLPEYMKWYPSGNYAQIQDFMQKQYGNSPGLSKEQLLKVKSPNYVLFQQFLNTVNAGLWIAAKLNMNGKQFIRDYNLSNLNRENSGFYITKDFLKLFEENLPKIGREPILKQFIAKVIDDRLRQVGTYG
jgi:hypothetical protein